MGLITKNNTWSAGETILAVEHNENFNTIYNEFNGNIDNANIKAGAGIVDSKLAQITTSDKVGGQAAIDVMALAYPVGSIYINATDDTNPATLLGFGTWSAFGAGRVMVGFDSGDTDFDAAEETGGAKTHTLTTDEMPAHTHSITTADSGAGSNKYATGVSTAAAGATGSTGGGSAHNNLQPYITCYFWKRTA